ncbi:MAG: hypothetical protein RMK74_17255, partial [Myxococcales bacterium]|nr:hypothetical protein [Myxococcales bacterium]
MRPPSRSGSAAAADAAEGEPPAAARRRVEPVDGKGRAAARLGERTDQGWTLERLLGIGGVAAVYVARGPDGSHAAVKILH